MDKPIVHLRFNRLETHCSIRIRRPGRLDLETANSPDEIPSMARPCKRCTEARRDRVALGTWSTYEVPFLR